MGANLLGLLTAVGITIFIVELLRRRILREKYAVLWLLVCAGLLLFSIFPGLLTRLADLLGFEVPANVWIRERVSNELKRLGEQAPTMRQAVRIASESVQAAYDARLHERARAANQPPVLTSSF